jgi:uncharacterized membrane protein
LENSYPERQEEDGCYEINSEEPNIRGNMTNKSCPVEGFDISSIKLFDCGTILLDKYIFTIFICIIVNAVNSFH